MELVKAGVLDGVKCIFGMRVSLLIPSGCVSTVPDTITAGGENFAQRVCGRGGHASTPQVLVDSLSIAAGGGGAVSAQHCVMSRNIDPKVLPALSITTMTTVTRESHNVIPDEVRLWRTARLCMREARESVPRMLEYVAAGVAAAHGATVESRLIREYVGTMSDATRAAAARRFLGDDKYVPLLQAMNFGEDVSSSAEETRSLWRLRILTLSFSRQQGRVPPSRRGWGADVFPWVFASWMYISALFSGT